MTCIYDQRLCLSLSLSGGYQHLPWLWPLNVTLSSSYARLSPSRMAIGHCSGFSQPSLETIALISPYLANYPHSMPLDNCLSLSSMPQHDTIIITNWCCIQFPLYIILKTMSVSANRHNKIYSHPSTLDCSPFAALKWVIFLFPRMSM